MQSWKLIDYQHSSLIEIGIEQPAPNMNMGQKTSPNEMESERQEPNKNSQQKTSSHSNGDYSIDVLTVLSPLKTNQFLQSKMMLQSVYQLNYNVIKWRKERMKDITSLYLSTLTLILLVSKLKREEITLVQFLERAIW